MKDNEDGFYVEDEGKIWFMMFLAMLLLFVVYACVKIHDRSERYRPAPAASLK